MWNPTILESQWGCWHIALVFWILIYRKYTCCFFNKAENIFGILYEFREKAYKSQIKPFIMQSDAFPSPVIPLRRRKRSHSFWGPHKSLCLRNNTLTVYLLRLRMAVTMELYIYCNVLLLRSLTSSWQQKTKSMDSGFIPRLMSPPLLTPASLSLLAAMCY